MSNTALVNDAYEQAVIAGLLRGRDIVEEYENLTDDFFYYKCNKILFKKIMEMYKNDKPIDSFTVINELKKDGKLEAAGGIKYITNTSTWLPGLSSLDYYVNQIKDLAYKRKAVEAAKTFIDSVQTGKDIFTSMNDFNSLTINPTASEYKECNLTNIMKELFEDLDSPNQIPKYKTGLSIIDKHTNGFAKGELVTIGANSGVGKSALSLRIAMNIYEESLKNNENIKILIISREMASKEFAKRILTAKTNINKQTFDTKTFDSDDWVKILDGISLYSTDNIRIDTHSKSIPDIKRHVKDFKPDILIVDYVQLLTPTNSKDSRERQVAEISRELKNITLDFNITVLQLTQLADKGNNWRPHGETYTRESRAIYQDSNIVIYIHRPTENKELEQIYKASSNKERQSFDEFKDYLEKIKDGHNLILTEIIVDKNRDGTTGRKPYLFAGNELLYFPF